MQYILNRLSESSSWAGLIAIITGVIGYNAPPEMVQTITAAGLGAVGLLLFIMKQSKSSDAVVSPEAVQNGKVAAK